MRQVDKTTNTVEQAPEAALVNHATTYIQNFLQTLQDAVDAGVAYMQLPGTAVQLACVVAIVAVAALVAKVITAKLENADTEETQAPSTMRTVLEKTNTFVAPS